MICAADEGHGSHGVRVTEYRKKHEGQTIEGTKPKPSPHIGQFRGLGGRFSFRVGILPRSKRSEPRRPNFNASATVARLDIAAIPRRSKYPATPSGQVPANLRPYPATARSSRPRPQSLFLHGGGGGCLWLLCFSFSGVSMCAKIAKIWPRRAMIWAGFLASSLAGLSNTAPHLAKWVKLPNRPGSRPGLFECAKVSALVATEHGRRSPGTGPGVPLRFASSAAVLGGSPSFPPSRSRNEGSK